MSEKITIDMLREHLDSYSAYLQKFAMQANAPEATKYFFDELAKYQHYMFSEIIDYLDQQK